MPWASGVLRGSGCLAAGDEKDRSEIARTDARQRQLRFMAGCVAVREKGVKWERERSDLADLQSIRLPRSRGRACEADVMLSKKNFKRTETCSDR